MVKTAVQKRLEGIRQALAQNEDMTVPRLAKEYNVSEMTIHRDLNRLEAEGFIVRTRGGVQPAEKMEFEFDFSARRSANQKAKKAIARQALNYILPGQRLILDTGTTTLELAFLLRDFEDLTVITPSLAVASVLQFSSGVQTVLLGGIIRKGSPDLTGVVTEKLLEMFMVDIVFQGADGIGLDGKWFTSDIRIARVDQEMRKRAEKAYVLCDSSKIGKTDLASNGSLMEVEALITDDRIAPEHLDKLKNIGIEIITAKT